jgi:RHS repeat-associated protein
LGLVSRIDANNSTHFYHDDFRGSIIALTNESETITHKYQYTDFGAITQIEEANHNPYRYVGKHGIQFENEGLYFMRARYYDANTGRFLSEDPIWATNLYPYAGNNPVMNIDRNGEVLETVADVGSMIHSSYELFNEPSWGNAGYLAWDVAATFIPVLPGSYVAKGGKILLKSDKIIDAGKHTFKRIPVANFEQFTDNIKGIGGSLYGNKAVRQGSQNFAKISGKINHTYAKGWSFVNSKFKKGYVLRTKIYGEKIDHFIFPADLGSKIINRMQTVKKRVINILD